MMSRCPRGRQNGNAAGRQARCGLLTATGGRLDGERKNALTVRPTDIQGPVRIF